MAALFSADALARIKALRATASFDVAALDFLDGCVHVAEGNLAAAVSSLKCVSGRHAGRGTHGGKRRPRPAPAAQHGDGVAETFPYPLRGAHTASRPVPATARCSPI